MIGRPRCGLDGTWKSERAVLTHAQVVQEHRAGLIDRLLKPPIKMAKRPKPKEHKSKRSHRRNNPHHRRTVPWLNVFLRVSQLGRFHWPDLDLRVGRFRD